MSSKVFAHTSGTAVLAAEVVWRPIVVAPRFMIVWKDRLSARSARLGLLFSGTDPMGRDLVIQGSCCIGIFNSSTKVGWKKLRWDEVFCGYWRGSSMLWNECRTTLATQEKQLKRGGRDMINSSRTAAFFTRIGTRLWSCYDRLMDVRFICRWSVEFWSLCCASRNL